MLLKIFEIKYSWWEMQYFDTHALKGEEVWNAYLDFRMWHQILIGWNSQSVNIIIDVSGVRILPVQQNNNDKNYVLREGREPYVMRPGLDNGFSVLFLLKTSDYTTIRWSVGWLCPLLAHKSIAIVPTCFLSVPPNKWYIELYLIRIWLHLSDQHFLY